MMNICVSILVGAVMIYFGIFLASERIAKAIEESRK